MATAAKAADTRLIGAVLGRTAAECHSETRTIDVDVGAGRCGVGEPIGPHVHGRRLSWIVGARRDLGQCTATSEITGRRSGNADADHAVPGEYDPAMTIFPRRSAGVRQGSFEQPLIEGGIGIGRASDDLAPRATAGNEQLNTVGERGAGTSGRSAVASAGGRAVAAVGINRIDVGHHAASRGVIEVALAQHLVGMKARRMVESEIPRQGIARRVAVSFTAVGAAGGHFDLGIDPGAVDPLMDDALSPVGKAIHGLSHRVTGRWCEREDRCQNYLSAVHPTVSEQSVAAHNLLQRPADLLVQYHAALRAETLKITATIQVEDSDGIAFAPARARRRTLAPPRAPRGAPPF